MKRPKTTSKEPNPKSILVDWAPIILICLGVALGLLLGKLIFN